MSWFLVSWVAWACPGGWFAGLVPPAARPLACKPQVRQEAYERLKYARARVAALGPENHPSLTLVQGLRLTERPVTWATAVKFEGGQK